MKGGDKLDSQALNLEIVREVDTTCEQAFPIIHKNSDCDFAILLITHCGIRIKERLHSEQAARKMVNRMIAKRKSHPVATNQTG